MRPPVRQVSTRTRLGTPPVRSNTTPRHPSFASIYPSSEAAASGVYSLLSFGYVPPTHPEHPDTFIPALLKLEEEAGDTVTPWGKRRRRAAPSDISPSHHPCGGWSSGFGNSLEDVYRDRGTASPRLTTKTRYSLWTQRGLVFWVLRAHGAGSSG